MNTILGGIYILENTVQTGSSSNVGLCLKNDHPVIDELKGIAKSVLGMTSAWKGKPTAGTCSSNVKKRKM